MLSILSAYLLINNKPIVNGIGRIKCKSFKILNLISVTDEIIILVTFRQRKQPLVNIMILGYFHAMFEQWNAENT